MKVKINYKLLVSEIENTSLDILHHFLWLHSEEGTASNCTGNIVRCIIVTHVGKSIKLGKSCEI